jgi:hypothetical protein
MPAKIIQVVDIPHTKSGKITEIAVRDIIHGRPVKNREALANPEALDLYSDLPDLQTPSCARYTNRFDSARIHPLYPVTTITCLVVHFCRLPIKQPRIAGLLPDFV